MANLDSTRLDQQAQSLARAAALILLVLAVGVLGYMYIGGEEYGVLDAVYMTVITLTTVGYGEIVDLSNNPGGRIFTIALLVLGAGIFVYFFSSLTAFIVDGNLDRILWRRRMRRALNVLEQHYIICGGGRTGRHMIRELLETNRPFVLVDIDETGARALAKELERDFPIVVGDATDDEILRLAGIERAIGLCVSTSVDKDNLLVTMTARMLRPDLRIVARCAEPRSVQKLQRAGADAVVSPYVIGGLRLVSELVRPDAVSFLDTMLRDKEKRLRIEEVTLREDSAAIGRTLGALRRDPIAGLLIIAVRETRSDRWTFNPTDEFRLEPGFAIVFMSSPEARITAQQRWAEPLGGGRESKPEARIVVSGYRADLTRGGSVQDSKLTITLPCALALGLMSLACSNGGETETSGVTFSEEGINSTPGDGDGDAETGDTSNTGCPPGGCLDLGGETDTEGPGCASGDGNCNQVDLLFIIDNSGTMGEEQINLSANFPLLIDRLLELEDAEGNLLNPDVHIMVTTTDLGHPNCSAFQPDGYEPARGAPQTVACSERLDDFTGLGSNPPSFPEACDCPVPIVPTEPHIEFAGPMGSVTNVPGNDIKGALSCIGPQGINGCGFESPLEAMLQATYSEAEWNGETGFLRDEAILAIAIITDEADCSVRSPDGYAYFADDDTYWEIDPDTGTKTQATSAVCWNAGVECTGPDVNGVYSECHSVDNGVLQPLTRYLNYLQNDLIANQNKEVLMLGILGVPEVTAHNPNPPYEPTAGGVGDLVYRDWIDGAYPSGDILPGDDNAATKQFQFGIGPGCTGEDGMGGFTGQAIPPVRVKEVCEALNDDDKVRCCIESVCDTDFSGAISCLAGIIQTTLVPIG